MSRDYKMGATVEFFDTNATVRMGSGEQVVAVGTVNGKILETPEATYVPLWCDRNGREATTVYVNTKNIIGQALKLANEEPDAPAAGDYCETCRKHVRHCSCDKELEA